MLYIYVVYIIQLCNELTNIVNVRLVLYVLVHVGRQNELPNAGSGSLCILFYASSKN